jgi:hypothetical protein
MTAVVPAYRCGAVPDSHRIPFFDAPVLRGVPTASLTIADETAKTKLQTREVGIYEKHGRLDGVWRNVVIVERLIEENLGFG